MKHTKIYTMEFASIYPLYVKKVERKNRTKEEVDKIIYWLTGYNTDTLTQQLEKR